MSASRAPGSCERLLGLPMAADEAVHLARDLSEMRPAGGGGRTVHKIVRREDLPVAPGAEKADPARYRPPSGSADEAGEPPARPAGREDAKPRDVRETRFDRAAGLRHQKGDAGHQDAVEPALQDRRQPIPPGRIDEDEGVAPTQVFDL